MTDTELVLHRTEYTDKETFGVLFCAGTWVCLTLELPWRDNARNVSCIPEGRYRLERRDSPSKGPQAAYPRHP